MMFDEIVQRYFVDKYSALIGDINTALSEHTKISKHTQGSKQPETFNVLAIGQDTNTLAIRLGEEYAPWVKCTQVILDEFGNLFDEDGNKLGNDKEHNYRKEPLIQGQTFGYVIIMNTYYPNHVINDPTLSDIEQLVYDKGSDNIILGQDLDFLDYIRRDIIDMKGAHEFGLLMCAARSVSENGRLVRLGVLPDELLCGMKKLLTECGFELNLTSPVNLSEDISMRLAAFDVARIHEDVQSNQLESIALFYRKNFGGVVYDKKGPFKEEDLPISYKWASELYPGLGSQLKSSPHF